MSPGSRDAAPAECPRSATHGLVAASGFLAFAAGVCVVSVFRPFRDIALSAVLVMIFTALGIYLPDLLWQRVQWRTLSRDARPGDWGRTWTKVAGLLGSFVFVGGLYWSFPEYYTPGPFYETYWVLLRLVLPFWILLAPFYIHWVDRRMPEPHDSLWQMGRLVTGGWGDVRAEVIGQHLLAWTVKGYFLPLMFSYMCSDLSGLLAFDYRHLTDSFKAAYDYAYSALYFVDVGLICLTYLVSLRLTDTHIRSTEPSMFGWVTALVCYQPFYALIGRQYLDYDSGTHPWGYWMGGHPRVFAAWGLLILALVVIYVWGTVSFGGRFSNLTHRGIITNGPYRYTKHPAYLSKNVSWWLISMPFMVTGPVQDTIRHTLMLLCLNFIYYLRAKTEERHLALDPVYASYARWIEAHGVLRFLNPLPLVGRIATWRPTFGRVPLQWVWPGAASAAHAAAVAPAPMPSAPSPPR